MMYMIRKQGLRNYLNTCRKIIIEYTADEGIELTTKLFIMLIMPTLVTMTQVMASTISTEYEDTFIDMFSDYVQEDATGTFKMRIE